MQAKVLAILTATGFVDSVSEGSVGLVLDQTSFYAESGGQTNDMGAAIGPSGSIAIGDAQVGLWGRERVARFSRWGRGGRRQGASKREQAEG